MRPYSQMAGQAAQNLTQTVSTCGIAVDAVSTVKAVAEPMTRPYADAASALTSFMREMAVAAAPRRMT
jgi:hypothetical protein